MGIADNNEFGAHFADEILDTVETPITVLDLDGNILRFNRICENLTQYSASEAIGRKIWEFLIVEEEVDLVREVFAKTCAEEFPTHFTNQWKTKSGERRLLKWANKPLRGKNGKIFAILATAIDITDLKSTEAELSGSQAFLRSVIDASPVSVITIDAKGKVLTFSKKAEATFGFSEAEVVGNNISMLMPEPDRSKHDGYMERYLTTREPRIVGRARPVTSLRKNGEEFPSILHVSEFDNGEPLFVGFVEDITEKRATELRLSETQTQLQHAGRVGAMGEIATSIAHELNQPLTAAASLVGAVSLTLKKAGFDETDDARSLLDDAVTEIRRASEIIRQMRDFVRKKKTSKSIQNVNKVVEDAGAIALIGAEAEGVDVDWRLSDDVGDISLDRIQIQQVLTNLIRNAVDAMRDSKDRRLLITTSKRDDNVEVTIQDTGCGISDQIKEQLFEPFVTDKPDGVGVGLAISKSIIDAHQGEIFAKNASSGGCEFTFRLPTGNNGTGHATP